MARKVDMYEALAVIKDVLRKRFEEEGIPFRNTVVDALVNELDGEFDAIATDEDD